MFSTAIGAVLAAHDGMDGPGNWWPIFPILWLLFFVTIAVLVSRRARRCGRGSRSSGVSRLSERYAAGEINETEYRERLAVLRESSK